MKNSRQSTYKVQRIYGKTLAQFSFLGKREWFLLNLLNQHDASTARHSVQVAVRLSEQLLRQHQLPDGASFSFAGLLADSGYTEENLVRAALLHDIGKLKISKTILLKAGPLSDNERQLVAKHAGYSEQILKAEGFMIEAKLVGQHHNAFTSSTSRFYFPFLKKQLAVADVIHFVDSQEALLSPRAYKPRLSSLGTLATICNDSRSGKIDHKITYFMVKGELQKVKNTWVAFKELNNLLIVRNFLTNEQKY